MESNDYNLNIRRYADNAPPPEPHDVRAHLVGGVPKAEVKAKKDLLSAHGLRTRTIFVERDKDYYDFDPTIKDRSEIKSRIENGKGIKAKENRKQAGVFNERRFLPLISCRLSEIGTFLLFPLDHLFLFILYSIRT